MENEELTVGSGVASMHYATKTNRTWQQWGRIYIIDICTNTGRREVA